jgi:hypothetical protein
MAPGNIVVFKADALAHGKMLIVDERDGWLICEAVHKDKDGRFPRNAFRPEDLEVLAEAKATA